MGRRLPVLALVLAACSSSSSTTSVGPGGGGPRDDGGVGDDAGGLPSDGGGAGDTGVATPKTGFAPRSGTTPGDKFPDLMFQGYRSQGSSVVTFPMYELVDPQATVRQAIVFVAGTEWDTQSNGTVMQALASTKKIAVVFVVGEGPTIAQNATITDVGNVHATYPKAYVGLDAGFAQTGAAFDTSAVPWVAILDARSMEVSFAGVGSLDTAAIDAEVAKIAARPPAF